MLGEAVSGNAPVVAAVERGRQAEMRRALPLPEPRLLGPIRLVPRPHRHPDLDPDPRRIAPGLATGEPRQYAFQRWPDFDEAAFKAAIAEFAARQRRFGGR